MPRVGLLVVVALLAATGGCVGFVTGSGSLNVTADRAAVAPDAVAASGYELAGNETQTINRTFEIAGQERRVNARIHAVTYVKAPEADNTNGSIEGGGTLTVVSVPGVNVAGVSVNPLDVLPDDLLLKLAGQQGVQMEPTGATNVTMLGQQVDGQTYRVPRNSTNLTIERASATHEGDLVVAIAVYPEGGESPRELISAIEHPA